MESTSLISILMPVRNTAVYLAECLDSIIAQTETNWELIAIDDYSTDHSFQILNQFAQKDDRIKVFKNKECGIIAALRLAFSKSKGRFITRMDSDDRMLLTKLACLKAHLLEYGKGHLAIGQVQYFSETQLGNGYLKYQNWLNKLSAKGENFKEIYKECVIPSPCWMLYRTDLEKCAAFELNRYPEDYDLCFRFYQNKLSVIPTNEVLHQWRDYQTRTSRTDPHYQDNRFLEIKLHYFLKLDYDPTRPLIIWGAGKKGKWIAQQLAKQQIPFFWVCNNEKKIGKTIYTQKLQATEAILDFKNPQIILTVAGDVQQTEIYAYLSAYDLNAVSNYFFFC